MRCAAASQAPRVVLSMSITVLLRILLLLASGRRTGTIGSPSSDLDRAAIIQFRHFEGSRPSDYLWDSPTYNSAWLQARDGVVRDPTSYASLSCPVPAQGYWGRRVLFQAFVSVRGVEPGKGYAALAVQVINGNGRTVAFDNMKGRPITGSKWTESWQWVVLDVPGPTEDDETCVMPEMLPLVIHVGFLLSGGRGFVAIDKVTLQKVGKDMEVTGGPPPWSAPRIIY